MTESSVLERLNDRSRFTDVEWQVIIYIQKHPEKVSVMNITDLSASAYTSNGTVIRICRKIGLNGFRDLKYALTREVEARRHNTAPVDFNTPFGSHQSVSDIIESMGGLYRESIEVTMHALDYKDIRDAAQLLHKSRNIALYASGDSEITLEGFASKLIKIGVRTELATRHNDQFYVTKTLKEGDCALWVSYSGRNPYIGSSIDQLKRQKIPMIAVTAHGDSEYAKKSDIRIVIPRKEGATDEKVGTFYSQISFSMILDVLYSLLYALNR